MMMCMGRTGVRLSGALSLCGSVCVLMGSLYCLIEDSLWLEVRNRLTAWIQESHRWDSTISTSIQGYIQKYKKSNILFKFKKLNFKNLKVYELKFLLMRHQEIALKGQSILTKKF